MNIIVASSKTWENSHFEYLRKIERIKNLELVKSSSELLQLISSNFEPDIIFFTHWSNYIKPEIYKKYKCILFHMTDLPYGRGGSPLQNLIINGHSKTKISAISVIKELDAGDVYLKHSLDLDGSAQQIYERASSIIHRIMIPKILSENILPTKQRGNTVFFKRRNPEESEIPKKINSSKELYDFIRMLDADGYPAAFIKHGKFILELTNSRLVDNEIKCDVKIKGEMNE